jgi:hypothetical protein
LIDSLGGVVGYNFFACTKKQRFTNTRIKLVERAFQTLYGLWDSDGNIYCMVMEWERDIRLQDLNEDTMLPRSLVGS